MMPSPDLAVRLEPFVSRGLIGTLPTQWQLMCGQVEMAPYVVLPDAGDGQRYAGAALGHPLLRTPLLLSQIGLSHLSVGHGLFVRFEAQQLHLNYVFHEGMPVYDLQVVQTHPSGLARLRELMAGLQQPTNRWFTRHRRLIDLVIPDAVSYRQRFLEEGGYIDRAERFDYDGPAADFLRPEFTSLVAFVNYCVETFPALAPVSKQRRALTLARLASRRIKDPDRSWLTRIAS